MTDQLSTYVRISEHSYLAPNGEPVRLLYATRTASLVCIPEAAADQLAEGALSELDTDLLDNLRRIEAVVDDDLTEREVVLNRQRTLSRRTDRRRFVLLPTTYCNMGCAYCGQEHTRGGLAQSHRDAVTARVMHAITDPEVREISISWFGAEPMIGYPTVLDMSEKFVAAAAEHGVDYEARMTTNGTLLTLEKLRKLHHDCRIWKFDITLDGPARIHDVHRPLKNGKGSFDRITGLLREALQQDDLKNVQFVLRTNIDVQNAAWVDEYLDTMANLGFATDQVMFNLAPVYAWGNDVSDREIARSQYADYEVGWMRKMLHLGLRFIAVPNQTVGALCAAVTQSHEIISSTGNVFSCSEYPLVPQHEATGGLGQLSLLPADKPRPIGPFDDWHDSVSAGATPCHSCVFLPVCGGSCPKQWREGNAACPPYKFNLEARFDLMAELNGLSRALVSTTN
jgi:uncharacterized protein